MLLATRHYAIVTFICGHKSMGDLTTAENYLLVDNGNHNNLPIAI
jgi:hypothetical protein